MNERFFYSAGSHVRRWGQDSGGVVDFFKILKEDGDYLVRLGSATIETQHSLFTRYPNKRRHHLVIDSGACDYTGHYKKQIHDGFELYDFDGNKEISCRCYRPETKPLVLNVVCDPEVEVKAEHRSFSTQTQYQLLATLPWQVSLFYFLFDDANSFLNASIGGEHIQIRSHSSLLVHASQWSEGVSINFFSEQQSPQQALATYSIYHFTLSSNQEGHYETQAS